MFLFVWSYYHYAFLFASLFFSPKCLYWCFRVYREGEGFFFVRPINLPKLLWYTRCKQISKIVNFQRQTSKISRNFKTKYYQNILKMTKVRPINSPFVLQDVTNLWKKERLLNIFVFAKEKLRACDILWLHQRPT